MKTKKTTKKAAKTVKIKTAADASGADVPDLFGGQFRTHVGKARLLNALAACHAIVSQACALAGIGRTTFYDWIKEDPAFKEAADSCAERALDFSESKLFVLIDGFEEKIDRSYTNAKGKKITKIVTKKHPPDSTAVIFHLNTKGKSRGYIKTTEFAIPDQITKINITRRVINSKDDLPKTNQG